MPRLLILCEYPTLLGGERSTLAALPAIVADGFDVTIAAPPTGALANELARRGVTHLPWQTHDGHGKRHPLDQLRNDLADLLRQVAPDLLHANSLSTSRISGPVAIETSTCSIGHLRDILKLAPQAIADLSMHTRLLAVSHATRDYHVAQGLTAIRCEVVYNGVDIAEFCPRPRNGNLRRELGLPQNAFCVIIVGQIGLRKGTDVAFQAAQQLAAEFTNLHWLIAGERTSTKEESLKFEANLQSTATQSPLVGHIHFLGSRTDMPTLLSECDLLVHAARQEPLGRVLLEAAATGLAIVATDVGGTREIFPTQANAAILVPPDSPPDLATAVREVLLNESVRDALGLAARRRAESAFDIRHAAANLIAQYRAVLQ